ncbi:MAG: hypothetical protein RBU30_19285 [Polyangia bacterium]|nr:hypothetical protein [Polyangia bacterium]
MATAPGCVFDTSGLGSPPAPGECGDGARNGNEACDGLDLGGQTCEGLGLVGGILACTALCEYDVSACQIQPDCGNGSLDAGEQCDGQNLDGQTCEGLGLGSGSLACTTSCQLDTSGCTAAVCGDGNLDPGEQCDGQNLDGQTCEGLGLGSGSLACTTSCQLDTSGCTAAVCGDGNLDPGEQCDDGDNDSCTGTCNADCSGPVNSCGDGIRRCGEACEIGDLQGTDCTDYGFANPVGLTCTACSFDPSGCVDTCGDGVLDPYEACDDGNEAPANGSNDFCEASCTESTWPCPGSWPGYIPPVNNAEPWLTWRDIVVNGSATGYATAAAGTSISITGYYEYDNAGSGCSTCRVQLYLGFFAGDPPADPQDAFAGWQLCADFVNSTPASGFSSTISVPLQPGTYFLRWGRGWDYGCFYDISAPPATHSLAALCVY